MNIAIVTPDYAGATEFAGGVGTLYATLAPALALRVGTVDVIAPTHEEAHTLEREGVTVRLVRVRRGTAQPLTFARAAARAIEVGAYDCVLASEYGGGAAVIANRPRSMPLVTHLHTSTVQAKALSNWPLGRRFHPAALTQIRFERRQTEQSDALIPSSRQIYEWTRQLWNVEHLPFRILRNPVPVDSLRRLAEGPLPDGFPDHGPVIVFSGRLEVRKGVHILVRAFRAVLDEVPDAQLVLLGPDDGYKRGWMSEHLRDVAGERWESIHLLGLQPPERVMPALAAADVVTLPSLWENYSLSALEALTLRCALIVTSGNGFDEIVTQERSALTVPPGEHEPLARAIVRLLSDPAMCERLGEGASEVAERHRPEVTAAGYEAFLSEIVAGGTSVVDPHAVGRGARRATTR